MRFLLLLAFTALLPFVSCHKSGGGGGPSGAGPAQIPSGFQGMAINMTGDWKITEVTLASTNLPKSLLEPPDMGMEIILSSNAVLYVDGEEASREAVKEYCKFLWNASLGWYLNQVNGRTVLFGYKAQWKDGTFSTLGAAGLAVDKDTIIATWAEERREDPGGPLLFEKYTIVVSRTGKDSSNLRFPRKESETFRWINR